MVAADDAQRLSGEKAVQVEASKVATDSAARIAAQMETNATKHAAQAIFNRNNILRFDIGSEDG